MYKCPEKRRECNALLRRKKDEAHRADILFVLGNKCVRCKNEDSRVLCIDHVNGGGSAERKKFGGNYYTAVRKKVLEGSTDYQLLCANCNLIKKLESKEGRKRKY